MTEFSRGIINNYFSVLGAQLASIPLSLLYISLTAKLLGPQDYGKFMLFLSCGQFFFCLFVNWARNATIRYGSEEYTRTGRLSRIFCIQAPLIFVVTAVAFIFIFIFKKQIALFTGLWPNTYLYITLFLFFYVVFDFSSQLFQASQRMSTYALTLILRQLIVLSVICSILFLTKSLSPLKTIFAETVTYASVAVFVLLILLKRGSISYVSFDKRLFKEVMVYSWPIIIHVVLGYFAMWADTLLIRTFLSFSWVGKYEIANRLIYYISNLIMPVSIVAFPIMVSIRTAGKEELIVKFAQRIIPQASFFWGIFVITLLLFSQPVFKLAFGDQYLDSVIIFQILLSGLAFQILPVMCTAIIQSFDMNKKLLFITIFTLLVNLTGDIIFIPKIGIIAAAFSKTASLVLAGLLYMFMSIKILQIKDDMYINSIIFLTVVPLLLSGFMLVSQFFYKAIISVTVIIIMYFVQKKRRIFTRSDVELIKEFNMPSGIKMLLEKIYGRLC